MRAIFGLSTALGPVDYGARPWCSTAHSRRLRKYLILKDFFASENRWRRGRDSPGTPSTASISLARIARNHWPEGN